MKILRTGFVTLALLANGSAWAQAATDVNCDGCVHSGDIATNGVRRADIQNFSINTPKLNNFAVTTEKIKTGAVTESKIADGAVGLAQVDPAQVQIRVGGSCDVGSFVAAINEDGSITCETGAFTFYNSRYGLDALVNNTSGWYNTASGHNTLSNNTSGGSNTASGAFALLNNVSGDSNTAIGDRALTDNSDGAGNTAVGAAALRKNTTGQGNTAVGNGALSNKVTGWNNIALGQFAGNGLTAGELNIYIQHSGAATESNTIRVGTQNMQLRTFVAGIRGVTTEVNDAQTVVIDSNGQLGTISSSARYKEDIRDMADTSERLLQLRPVSFRFKQPFRDGEKPIQYGLVAEEVARVFPELVILDEAGQPQTVKYHILSSLLLNELQKQEHRTHDQAQRISDLETEMLELRQLVSQVVPLQGGNELLAKNSH